MTYQDRYKNKLEIDSVVFIDEEKAKQTRSNTKAGWIIKAFIPYEMAVDVALEHRTTEEVIFLPLPYLVKSYPKT